MPNLMSSESVRSLTAMPLVGKVSYEGKRWGGGKERGIEEEMKGEWRKKQRKNRENEEISGKKWKKEKWRKTNKGEQEEMKEIGQESGVDSGVDSGIKWLSGAESYLVLVGCVAFAEDDCFVCFGKDNEFVKDENSAVYERNHKWMKRKKTKNTDKQWQWTSK